MSWVFTKSTLCNSYLFGVVRLHTFKTNIFVLHLHCILDCVLSLYILLAMIAENVKSRDWHINDYLPLPVCSFQNNFPVLELSYKCTEFLLFVNFFLYWISFICKLLFLEYSACRPEVLQCTHQKYVSPILNVDLFVIF